MIIMHDALHQRWLRFEQPLCVLQAQTLDEVLPLLQTLEQRAAAEGLWAAGFVAYEAAPAFDPALQVCADDSGLPLAWFGLYPPPQPCSLDDLPSGSYQLGPWQPSVDRQPYEAAIAAIKAAIARGDTYQVNYTLRLRATFEGDAWALFHNLAAAQQADYPAYLDCGRFVLCSASPELFFTLHEGRITGKPMKGTAGRGRTQAEDQAQAAWLAGSEKNQAENVMIVDMLRNDLGRIARTGSVCVPRLFELERYPSVWQMTSTVQADLAAGVGLSAVMQALFPCASITGAPKVSTMRIIAALEGEARGAYCGSIGFLAPDGRAQFNVAIRTVQIDRERGTAQYGVGGGIVWDSTAAEEYEEWRIKARLLTQPRPRFELLESLLWTPQTGCCLLAEHLQRLSQSAAYFGYAYDPAAVSAALAATVRSLSDSLTQKSPVDMAMRNPPELPAAFYPPAFPVSAEDVAMCKLPAEAHKLRLLLDRHGQVTLQAQPLAAIPLPEPARIQLAAQPIASSSPFLFHKTTYRQAYALTRQGLPEGVEALLWNERGELTESENANLVLRLDGALLTPALTCGLLPGTLRQYLLERGLLHEAVLYKADLARAEEIWLINSVRGWRRGQLL